jgi:hypothetical protein
MSKERCLSHVDRGAMRIGLRAEIRGPLRNDQITTARTLAYSIGD